MPFKFGLLLLALMFITQHCVARSDFKHADQLNTDKEDDIPDLQKRATPVCADRELTSRCEDWRKAGYCNTDPSGVYIYCFKTCGGCNHLCHDSRSDCKSIRDEGLCQTSISAIRACPVTCGACLFV